MFERMGFMRYGPQTADGFAGCSLSTGLGDPASLEKLPGSRPRLGRSRSAEIVSWVGERATTDLRSAVYAGVLAQSPRFFETLQTGEVLSRRTGDTTLIQTLVGSSISMGLRGTACLPAHSGN